MKEQRRSKYDIVVHMETDDVHTRQIRWVGHDQVVLECGCDTGYVSRVLTEDFGCRVTGIEMNPVAAETARAVCEQVFVADVEDFDFETELTGGPFDVVLFGDVLEHLKNPWAVLDRVRAVLKPDGRVIASIPNIAERNVILNLMLGRFEYRKLGLLDETHLRFFTAETVRRMFESSGFVISRLERIENEIVENEVPVDLDLFPAEFLAWLGQHNVDSRTIQFLVEAHQATDAGTIASLRGQFARSEQAGRERERDLRDEVRAVREQTERLSRAREEDRREDEERVLRQQSASAEQLRRLESRWQERLAQRTEALRAVAKAHADNEVYWRARAYGAEVYSDRLAAHPLLRMLRRVRRLLRP
jgi:2-polyprenyl-3-methyl-5-hydroxy-6-metoxy-1,4-benzoquinol methylase